jgi:hypothetical protein
MATSILFLAGGLALQLLGMCDIGGDARDTRLGAALEAL